MIQTRSFRPESALVGQRAFSWMSRLRNRDGAMNFLLE